MHPILGSLPVFVLPVWVYLASLALVLFVWAFLGRKGAWLGLGGASLLAALLGLLAWLLGAPVQSIVVPTYGVVVSLSLLVAFVVALWRCRARALPLRESGEALLASVAVGFLGARLGFWLSHPSEPSLESVSLLGGLSSMPGLVLGGLYLAWFSSRQERSFVALADAVAPAVLLGLALGRLACFFHGCDFGAPTDSFLAVTYPAEWPGGMADGSYLQSPISLYQHSEAFAARFPEWVPYLEAYDDRSQGAPLSLPVHPLPLYEAVACLLLGALAWRFSKGGAFFSLVLYAAVRFLVDFFRGDDEPLYASLTLAQWVATLALLGATLGWLGTYLRRRSR